MAKDGSIEIMPGFVIAESDLQERFSHSPGPGGQGVNTADSRVELMFNVRRSDAVPHYLRPVIMSALENRLVDGVLTVTVHDQRSQLANRRLARARLVEVLQAACIQPRRRRPTKRTRGSQRRRLDAKRRHSELKKNRQRPQW
ncbi:aminoacyl-tRNA hydrolase [Cutibacterium sp. WCA-380-WT-3A]|uniref:Aminoacyl-tRNA hydrolase n=1 Tax=Cutibacterium porci TaxID=2605781 RepID=A0A7K0J645_9ACTN|nr:alternative ribosome rescue aminoacyl-tRNA hydrolase ArfB [Cutibacterium porci]MSS45431.1 aminoacyl-tRNA hydrolase [Cutibacterium porci]